MKILILGCEGMLGYALFTEYYKNHKDFNTYGTVLSFDGYKQFYSEEMRKNFVAGIDINNFSKLEQTIKKINPAVIINCIGIIKQNRAVASPLIAIGINSLFPHKLAELCGNLNIRMIHPSTDCVFSGKKGNYKEADPSDAEDLYGKTKFLGEVSYRNTVTLRTSIIGHELKTNLSLISWFLSQTEIVKGYTNAIYTGFPTVEIANIIAKYIIPDTNLYGLYHVSSQPISKYDLLILVKEIYNKDIDIKPFNEFYDNKSLDSSRFRSVTGYVPPDWKTLIIKMHDHYLNTGLFAIQGK
jgi:dTDP-4-dehydrorhamnose reductase